ncbi:MAG: EAL domain-containing protein [Azospirillaceae bacterium]|nr:EAL domain-containing protein [Azospirillaceae bacterium]
MMRRLRSYVPGRAPTAAPSRGRRLRATIATLVLGLAAGLALVALAMIVIGVLLRHDMRWVADNWQDYDVRAATRADALSEVRANLGFGGVANQFREYQASGSEVALAALARSLTLARANLQTYVDVAPTTPAEGQAVADIVATLDALEARLPEVAAQRAAGVPVSVIRDQTGVDITAAVAGLDVLSTALSRDRVALTETTVEGIDRLRHLMTWGGAIVGLLVLALATAAVWVTRQRIIRPLARLVAESRLLAHRHLDQRFVWEPGDELGLLGQSLENSRAALQGLFAEIDEKTDRLTESEQRYAMAAAAANDGLWDWDGVADRSYRSQRFNQLLGLDDGVAASIPAILRSCVHADDRARVDAAWCRVMDGAAGAGDSLEIEFRLPATAAAETWILLRGIVARDAAGRVVRAAGSASDISDRKSFEARLVYQATHDHLTGLSNRAFLVEWLRRRFQIREGSRQGALALLFLDLDGFKLLNDSLGHGVGDALLVAVGQRVGETLGSNQFLARLGGDEFVVVVETPGSADGASGALAAALDCAERIETALKRPFLVNGMELTTSTSIGLAVDDGQVSDADSLLRDADIALYRAKDHGRARTEVFNAALREAVLVRHRLQTELGRAIDSGEIFLAYQPIVALDSRVITGFEALVRWRHPELGLISPATFIPIAEETGQILPLGRFVLETAVATLADWRRLVPADRLLSVNVNLSARQIWDERYIAALLEFLGDGHAEGLKIEVTESMTMTNPDMALAMFRRFHALGVSLCIDDFGTGYSSLSSLARFPFDVLKIDKSFVTGLPESPEQRRLVRGIVNLAHDLGLSVVGEGIETEAEWRCLSESACDFGQGYLFSRPVERAVATALLSEGVGPGVTE